MLSKIELIHVPAALNTYIALYRDVKNAAFLREQLVNENSEFEFAFIDAKSILSPTHVLAAVFRAVSEMTAQKMKSRNVHSEIVFCLSSNNNIAESFRKFGVTDQTNDLLVVKVSQDGPGSYAKLLEDNVQGQSFDFTEENLSTVSNESYIRKTYKLPISTRSTEDHEDDRKELEYSILGLMALRGAT